MKNSKEHFKKRIMEHPLIVEGLQRIEDDEIRRQTIENIDASAEEFSRAFETLSAALSDPKIVEQVVEEFKRQNSLVNSQDRRNTEKK